jgi:hypothetical protein
MADTSTTKEKIIDYLTTIQSKNLIALTTLQKETNVEDELFSNWVAQSIESSLKASLSAVELEEKINNQNETLAMQKEIHTKDLEIKEQAKTIALNDSNNQIALRNQQILESKNRVSNNDKLQTLKETQNSDNKKIKAMDSMGTMIGSVGMGGLVPSSTMWTTYFSLNRSLTSISTTVTDDMLSKLPTT